MQLDNHLMGYRLDGRRLDRDGLPVSDCWRDGQFTTDRPTGRLWVTSTHPVDESVDTDVCVA